MFKYRIPLFILIALGITITTWVLIQIGEGYRPNIKEGTITATGLLSADSQPQGAQLYINGQLTTATDDTLSLKPDIYDVEIKKDAFLPWKKRLTIEAGLVTQTQAILFPIAPDLKAITYSGITNTSLSPNGTKIIYTIPPESTASAQVPVESQTLPKDGLWLLDLVDLPLGFSRDPRQLVSGKIRNLDWQQASFQWSPDSRQLLALFPNPEATSSSNPKTIKTTSLEKEKTPKPQYTAAYLINTAQSNVLASTLTNQIANKETIEKLWQLDRQERQAEQIKSLAPEFSQLLATAAAEIIFSPDESKLMYTATASATLLPSYVPPLLATSTQTQTKTITPNNLYVYDIKEDRNFLIQENYQVTLPSDNSDTNQKTPVLMNYQWFPTSRHLIKTEKNQITILEYDNTNHATIYSGLLVGLNVYPHPSGDKLYILTTLNPAQAPLPNLYALILQ